MNWLFGKKKNTEVKISQKTESKTNAAIQNNQATYERLEKRQRLLQKKMDLESEKAKDFVQKGNKPAAMQCLKNKKQLQAQYDTLAGQMSNLFGVTNSLENAVTNIEVVKANQNTSETMKEIFKEIGGIEKVEDLVDDVRDTMDKVNDVGNVLAQPLGDAMDDDELDDELNMLEASVLDSQLSQMKTATSKLPQTSTATAVASTPKKQEESDFDELEAELNALSA